MKLSIKNLAKIKEADIEIDGITVICGNNNTGKSTGNAQRMERKTGDHGQGARELPGGSLHRLHPRRSRALQGDREGSGGRLHLHHEGQHRGRRIRRQRGPGAWQHRRPGRHAGDGGQGRPLQGVRRRQRGPHLPGHPGYRGDHPDSREHRACLRRHQSGGHQRPPVL